MFRIVSLLPFLTATRRGLEVLMLFASLAHGASAGNLHCAANMEMSKNPEKGKQNKQTKHDKTSIIQYPYEPVWEEPG